MKRDKPKVVNRKRPVAVRAKSSRQVSLLVATRKGAWMFHGDAARRSWRVDGPHFLGHVLSQLVLDPRDGRTLLAAAKTGHLGPTAVRSTDRGRSWTEAKRPPAFAKAAEGEKGRSVDHTFWLTPAHRDEPNVWYAGTSPHGCSLWTAPRYGRAPARGASLPSMPRATAARPGSVWMPACRRSRRGGR